MSTKNSKPFIELCADYIPANEHWPQIITGISMDSREVKPGDLFIACMGHENDARAYIADAVAAGAVAVLFEAGSGFPQEAHVTTPTGHMVPSFGVQNLWQKAGLIIDEFFDSPSAEMTVIGVTGTNGKTSIAQYLARSLCMAGNQCGVVGTIGNGFPDALTPTTFTTPTCLELQTTLSQLHDQGANAIAMEVSSHGLAMARVQGVHFDIAVFSNLTRDHLDFHGDMQRYGQAKQLLFQQPGLGSAVVNIDDEFGQQIVANLSESVQAYGYSSQNNSDAAVTASDIQYDAEGFTATVRTPWGEGTLHSGLLGEFNLSNLLAVVTVLGVMGYALTDILQWVGDLPGVAGRMQRFGGGDKPLVVVDYAHTPDALEKALTAIKAHTTGAITTVFGCGGDRDKGKRPEMAAVAERLSDKVIVTSDNPRHEEPEAIIEDICQGFKQLAAVHREVERQRAIHYAITGAGPGDIVLIAGKGHEAYQQIGDTKHAFSDQQQVQQALRNDHEDVS
ncbi:MAG: UDP-N-acetylmuramoyl-L-alanyl-D-glutamate--2,6-diaminopimelate ligase [Legionellales bacterium]|nr:UDP-N-acetylmuramoyl-L-alanyl-D-glutamate--2,6-diaminopimelate ligase [Legionellales bacterium]|tara:strand:+ start:12569 stop:14086 length:1518 start_codon:yes stop_codon:yes gene_type:complete